MTIPKSIMNASEAIHRVELRMEAKSTDATSKILDHKIDSVMLSVLYKFELAIVKGVDHFIQSLFHSQHKHY